MSGAQNVYNLLLGGEKLGRWKGEQRGAITRIGNSYYGRWREFVTDEDGKIAWKQVKKKLCDVADGRRRAIDILDENVQKAGAPAACHQQTATLRQFVDVRFRPERMENLKPNGKRFYEEQFKPILAALGDFRLKEFSPVMIQAFLKAQAIGRSSQTLRHRFNVIKEVFKYAKKCNFWRGDLPTEVLNLPEVAANTPTALGQAQIASLIAALPDPCRSIVLLMATTGLRVGEALALRWDNIDLDRRLIHVRVNFSNGKWTTPKTKSSYRTLPINEDCRMALEAQVQIGPNGWLVFPNRYGCPLDAHNLAARVLKPACKIAGLKPIGWHALRHTAITLLEQNGLEGADRKLLAGHSTERMTDHYTHPTGDRMRAAVDQMKFVKTDGRLM